MTNYIVPCEGSTILLIMSSPGLPTTLEYIDRWEAMTSPNPEGTRELNLENIIIWAIDHGYADDFSEKDRPPYWETH